MTAYRKDRLASEIVRQTSRLVQTELSDPRLGFVTVTRAKVSDDYKYATVYVSVMGTAKLKKLSLSGLRHACGFKLANDGHDTRALQHYLGHKNLSHTVRYTDMAADRFKSFWKD